MIRNIHLAYNVLDTVLCDLYILSNLSLWQSYCKNNIIVPILEGKTEA